MTQSDRSINAVTGKPMDRVDGRLKVTGTAQFSAEYPQKNLAYAVLIGSKIARGSVKSIDTSAAEKAPGVLAILTHANAPKLNAMPAFTAGGGAAENRIPLSDSNIYHAGQYIGVVVADTFECATHAAELVRVAYAQQPPLIDMKRLRNQAVVPKGKVKQKPADTLRGNFEQGLAQAKVRVEETYTTPTEHHNPMEPHATTAIWESDRLTIYDSTQNNFGTRKTLAAAFGIPEENVRFVGAFGTGRVMNMKTARSQLIGGITMGIGMALLEETVTDHRYGRIVNPNLGEYHVPVNPDIPAIEAYFVAENDPHVNLIGAKGVGEIGITGVAAAVANAIYHATGKRIRDLPITPDKLL